MAPDPSGASGRDAALLLDMALASEDADALRMWPTQERA
jgi:hypothetical protein